MHLLCLCDIPGGLAELEQCTKGGKADQWLPRKKVSHNVLLQQRKLEAFHHLQKAWGDGHVLLWLHGSII